MFRSMFLCYKQIDTKSKQDRDTYISQMSKYSVMCLSLQHLQETLPFSILGFSVSLSVYFNLTMSMSHFLIAICFNLQINYGLIIPSSINLERVFYTDCPPPKKDCIGHLCKQPISALFFLLLLLGGDFDWPEQFRQEQRATKSAYEAGQGGDLAQTQNTKIRIILTSA